MKAVNGGLSVVDNVYTAGVHAGFKKNKKDLALIYFPKGATVAGVFTKSLIQAHPLIYDKKMLEENSVFKAILINSGNANACNGNQGDKDVETMAMAAANKLQIEPQEVLISSTGVIGEPMDLNPLNKGLDIALAELNEKDSTDAAEAIMTTDTKTKQLSYEIDIAGEKVHIGAFIKGAGMIHPNMGTLLGYVTTDLAVPQNDLSLILKAAVAESFNQMTVDGDMSTNDTVLLASTSEVEIELTEQVMAEFREAVTEVCKELSKMIVADGEGATKFVEVNVHSAANKEDAVKVAKQVATSNLVKTAIYGSDANWGRVIGAIGQSEPEVLDPYKISISFLSDAGEILVCQNGMNTFFDEEKALKILSEDEIQINIDLGVGKHFGTVWTCDMSVDYIKINSDYRS